MYAAPPVAKTEIFVLVPDRFSAKENVSSPNGLVLTPSEEILHLAGDAQQCRRVPFQADGIGRVGIFIQLSGGMGPDGRPLHHRQ